MTTFSKEAEERLVAAVRKVAEYADEDGMTPTQAVVKVAEELRTPQAYVPLLCQAYNQGRAAMQREQCDGEGVLCKVATFPLAIVEDAMAQLYPATIEKPASILEKTAVAGVYSKPPKADLFTGKPALVKTASVAKPKAEPKVSPFHKLACANNVFEVARREARDAADKLQDSLGEVANYFRKIAHDRRPLDEVRRNADWLFGPAADHVLDYAAAETGLHNEKCACQMSRKPIGRDQPPYSLVQTAISDAEVAVEKYAALAKAETSVANAKQALRPVEVEKSAAGFFKDILTGAAGGLAMQGLSGGLYSPKAKSTPDLVNDAEFELTDPRHGNQMQQIQTRAMLQDLMSNDEVISGYDPYEVMNAYNEISQLSPRASTQPAIMRPLLRKRLTAGQVEPFEAEQMANVEKTIRETEDIGAPANDPSKFSRPSPGSFGARSPAIGGPAKPRGPVV